MLFARIFYFVLGGTLEIFGWVYVCAAGILEPLAYTRASSSEFFPPYTRLNLPVYLFSRIQLSFINIIIVTKWFVPAPSIIWVLFAFKICFDQMFEVGIFLGRFQQKMQLWPGCVFKVYATHFLMWPPLWYNSKLAKSIPLFLNPYPFIQKSPWLLQCIFIMM